MKNPDNSSSKALQKIEVTINKIDEKIAKKQNLLA